MRILLAEDDLPLANFLREGLGAEHYSVDVCSEGERALARLREASYDVVVLDLNAPSLDSIAVLKRARVLCPAVPVVILTTLTRIEDRVRCFDAGADDYVAKPFSFAELSARIRALIRRSHLPSEAVLSVGDLRLNRVARSVERGGRSIELTAKEFELLEFLMRNAGRRVTRAMIIENVWKMAFPVGATNVVDVYINYLRRKVDDGWGSKLIHTLRGVGYELSCPREMVQ
jgi:two-component system copper resistance phosphate regulon response regulator CusR